jgi:hypothetical protein
MQARLIEKSVQKKEKVLMDLYFCLELKLD